MTPERWARVKELFQAAVELADQDRGAFLKEHCGADEELLQQVTALLRQHRPNDNLPTEATMQTKSANLPATDMAPSSNIATEKVGDSVGPYRLLEKIGEGGFGIVYMAEQQHPIRRKVALKIIKPGMDTRQVIARFEAERQALALMDHPNIAKVLDAGETASGRPFFVMELVKGLPITAFCDQTRLPLRDRLELFSRVCQAVQHAHYKGIIHRDLKPSNILVALRDGQPVVKIIDFGIAKATGNELTDKTLFTGFAQVLGTPLYASPEQVAFSILDIDTRTDVYSLGVLLYELLTGTTPFEKDRLQKAAYDEMRRIIREEDPPRPSTRVTTNSAQSTLIAAQHTAEPRRLAQLFRGELDWIVMKALEKDRTRRYETPLALAGDIARYLANEAVQARPPSTLYRTAKFLRRNRFKATLAAVIAASLVCGLITIAVSYVAVQRQRALAVAGWQEAGRKELEVKKQYAEGLLDQGLANNYAQRWGAAKETYVKAFQGLKELGQPTAPADIGKFVTLRAAPPPLMTLPVQGTWDTQIALSPDGRILYQWEWGSGVRAWNSVTGKLVRQFNSQGEGTAAIALSGDGRILLTGHTGTAQKLWNTATGEMLGQLIGHNKPVRACALSYDGSVAATLSEDQNVRVWDTKTGKNIRSYSLTQPVKGLAVSPNGHHLVYGGLGAQLWNIDTGEEISLGPYFAKDEFTYFSFSADNQVLVGTGYNHTSVWDLRSLTQISRIARPGGRVEKSLAVPSSAFLLGCEWRGLLLDSRDGTVARFFEEKPDSQYARSIAIADSGRFAAMSIDQGEISLWGLRDSPECLLMIVPGMHLSALALSRDARLLVSAVKDKPMIQCWDSQTGTLLLALECPTNITDVKFSPDGRLLAAAGVDGRVYFIDPLTFQVQSSFKAHDARAECVAFSPDGTRLATGGEDMLAKVWDLQTRQEISRFSGHKRQGYMPAVHCVAFTLDGTRVVSGGQKGFVVWSAATGQKCVDLPANDTGNFVALHPDGHQVFGSSFLGGIHLWNIETGEPIRQFSGPQFSIKGMALSPDASFVVASTGSLWDLHTGRLLLDLPAEFTGPCIATDGKFLFIGGDNDRITRMDLTVAAKYRQFNASVPQARQLLAQDENNAPALLTLGRWYAFRGQWEWAIESLEKARALGQEISPLEMARVYLPAGDRDKARSEIRSAIRLHEAPYDYLQLLLHSLPPSGPVGASWCSFSERAPAGGLIIGFHISKSWAAGAETISSVQPVYRQSGESSVGKQYGTDYHIGNTDLLARDGYALAALTIDHDNVLVRGIRATFARHIGDRLDPADTYQSDFVGISSIEQITLGGDGIPIVGIQGGCGAHIDSLGLILAPAPRPGDGTSDGSPAPATTAQP